MQSAYIPDGWPYNVNSNWQYREFVADNIWLFQVCKKMKWVDTVLHCPYAEVPTNSINTKLFLEVVLEKTNEQCSAFHSSFKLIVSYLPLSALMHLFQSSFHSWERHSRRWEKFKSEIDALEDIQGLKTKETVGDSNSLTQLSIRWNLHVV